MLAAFFKLLPTPLSPSSITPIISIHHHNNHHHESETYSRLHRIFSNIDKDGDGQLTAHEIQHFLHSLNIPISTPQLYALFHPTIKPLIEEQEQEQGEGSTDLPNTTTIDFTTFRSLLQPDKEEEEEEEEEEEDRILVEAFHVFDENGDGFISSSELHRALSFMGEDDYSLLSCQQMIDNVDSDGNGLIDFSEFKHMMLNFNAQNIN